MPMTMSEAMSMTRDEQVAMIADITRRVHEEARVQREQLTALPGDNSHLLEELDRQVAEMDMLNDMVRRFAAGDAAIEERQDFKRRLANMLAIDQMRAMPLPGLAN